MNSRLKGFSILFVVFGGVVIACSASTTSDGGPPSTPSTNQVATEPDIDANAPTFKPPTSQTDAGAPTQDCRMRRDWNVAPDHICKAATGVCMDNAKTTAEFQACLHADIDCSTCFDQVLTGCVIGSGAKPGECGHAAGCVDGCISQECGEKSSSSCEQSAIKKACKGVSTDLQSCLDQADQNVCIDRLRTQCIPKKSCGNGVVETGEACDGNCPTSCPAVPAGDFCTQIHLTGNAATCSTKCETQSSCPAGCPVNAAPITTVGVIESGTSLPSSLPVPWPSFASLKSHGCPSLLGANSHVVSWKAPAKGHYTFTATCDGVWEEFEKGSGNRFTQSLECVRSIALVRGKQCTATADAFACALDVDNNFKQGQLPDAASLAAVDLKAGDEILIATQFGFPFIPAATTNNTYGGKMASTSWSVSVSECTPSCSGKNCGSDGCGGSCGTCGTNQACNASGKCQSTCVPSCTGRNCGNDGCGGLCGTCVGNKVCSAWGTCEAPCVPSCSGKTCGGDGCGGSCGTCAGNKVCGASGSCEAPCVPSCSGKTCGSNGCGGSCGFCGTKQFCNASNKCESTGACDPVSNSGCTGGNQCITLSNESNQCVVMGSGRQGASCGDSSSCAGGFACFGSTCRKVCDKLSGAGCGFDETCASVAGWSSYGTCAATP